MALRFCHQCTLRISCSMLANILQSPKKRNFPLPIVQGLQKIPGLFAKSSVFLSAESKPVSFSLRRFGHLSIFSDIRTEMT